MITAGDREFYFTKMPQRDFKWGVAPPPLYFTKLFHRLMKKMNILFLVITMLKEIMLNSFACR